MPSQRIASKKGTIKSRKPKILPVENPEKTAVGGGILNSPQNVKDKTETNKFISTAPVATPPSNSKNNDDNKHTATENQSPPRRGSRSPSKSPARKPKKHSEEVAELKRNWKTSAMNPVESDKVYQQHLKTLQAVKPTLDTKPPFIVPVKGKAGAISQNFKKKYPKVAKHYSEWNGSFVFENSLLSPRERHRIATWKGVDETIPLKISAPFSGDSPHVAPPQDSSVFAHQIRGTVGAKGQAKTTQRQRPSTAPSARTRNSDTSINNKANYAQTTANTATDGFRHTYNGSESRKGNHLFDLQDSSAEHVLQEETIKGEGGDGGETEPFYYASGSGTNVARGLKNNNQTSRQGNSNNVMSNTQAAATTGNLRGEANATIDKAKASNNEEEDDQLENQELESEELLINRLPAIGLQAYDTLCKVLAHLEPADRVKVVECALIDSSEISKARQKKNTETK